MSEYTSARCNISKEEISSATFSANSPEALIWTDTSKIVVGCSAADQEILGYRSDELKGGKLQAIIRGGFPDSKISLCTLRAKRAKLLIASVSASTAQDGRKNNSWFVIRIFDIAAPAYTPFDFPVNRSPVASVMVHNGRIATANQQVMIDTGFYEEELFNRDLLSFIHPEDSEEFDLRVVQQLKGYIAS